MQQQLPALLLPAAGIKIDFIQIDLMHCTKLLKYLGNRLKTEIVFSFPFQTLLPAAPIKSFFQFADSRLVRNQCPQFCLCDRKFGFPLLPNPYMFVHLFCRFVQFFNKNMIDQIRIIRDNENVKMIYSFRPTFFYQI